MTVVQLDQKLIERGRNFERYQIDERSFKVIIGVPAWVKDDSGKYVPYIVNTYDDYITVKSGKVSYNLYNDRLEYFDPDMTELRATERISLVLQDRVPILQFLKRSIAKNESGVFITQTYSVLQEGVKLGEVDVTYAQRIGEPLRHIVRSRNLSNGLAKSLHFTWEFPTRVDEMQIGKEEAQQTWSLDERSVIYPNDSFEDVRITKQGRLWINETTVFNKEILQEIRASNSRITWIYSGWKEQVLLKYGFTGTFTTGTDGFVYTGLGTAAACGAPAGVNKMSTRDRVRIPPSPANASCMRAFIEWDPGLAAGGILSITIVLQVIATDGRVVNIINLNGGPQPSTMPAGQLWNAIGAGAVYTNAVCSSIGQITIPLPGAAADMNAHPGWFAVGIRFDNEAPDGVNHGVDFASFNTTAPPQLQTTGD